MLTAQTQAMDVSEKSNVKLYISWALQIIIAGLFPMFGLNKLIGNESAVALFSTLGVEPWGRYATGGFEVIAAILILVPRLVVYGAGLTAGIMLGAIFSHLTVLGIDGMFVMAVLLLIAADVVLLLRRNEWPILAGSTEPSQN